MTIRPASPETHTHLRNCGWIANETAEFAGRVGEADLAARVPTAKRWTLGDLVHHTGAIHRWVTAIVADQARRNRRVADSDDWSPSLASGEAAAWLTEGAARLIDVLRGTPPDSRVWTWGPGSNVGFWSRRMAHETAVHRADAEIAFRYPPRFPSAFAVDGVDEFLANLWRARAWRWSIGKLRGDGERIRLRAVDTDDYWVIELTDGPFRWSHHRGRPRARADVSVRGTASDVYLLAWRRYRHTDDRYVVRGDRALLHRWYSHSAV